MLDANSEAWRLSNELRTGIPEEQRQAPILADIARFEQELAAAVAQRDQAEGLLGIRRGPGFTPDHSRGTEAHGVIAEANYVIDHALQNLRILEHNLAHAPTPPLPSGTV